jgi:hypothetical protein
MVKEALSNLTFLINPLTAVLVLLRLGPASSLQVSMVSKRLEAMKLQMIITQEYK